VAVKLNSILLSTTVPNAGAQSSNFATYRDVIGVADNNSKSNILSLTFEFK